MTACSKSEALLAAAPFVGRFVGKLFGVEAELEHLPRRGRARTTRSGASGRTSRRSASCAPTRARPGPSAPTQARGAAQRGAAVDDRGAHRRARRTRRRRSRRRRCRSSRSTTWRARRPRPAAPSGPTSSADARAQGPRGGRCRSRPTRASGEDDASLGRAVAFALDALEAWLAARRRGRARPAAPLGDDARPQDARLRRTSSRSSARTPQVPELFVGPAARAPPATRLLAHRSPHERARGRAGDRLLPALPRPRQGLVLQGPARHEDRRDQEEPARRRARRLPARREDQRDARDAAGGRARRRARARHASTTRCARAPATASATTA